MKLKDMDKRDRMRFASDALTYVLYRLGIQNAAYSKIAKWKLLIDYKTDKYRDHNPILY